jgi:hypothetical protein
MPPFIVSLDVCQHIPWTQGNGTTGTTILHENSQMACFTCRLDLQSLLQELRAAGFHSGRHRCLTPQLHKLARFQGDGHPPQADWLEVVQIVHDCHCSFSFVSQGLPVLDGSQRLGLTPG